MMRKYVMLSAFLAICSATAFAQGPSVIETDLCNLVAHAKQFDKKQVKVRAELLSGRHGAALSDSHCKQGVALWIAPEARDHADFQDMERRVVRTGLAGTYDKTVYATFTGEFLHHAKEPATHKKVMVLDATKVENLDVKYNGASPQ